VPRSLNTWAWPSLDSKCRRRRLTTGAGVHSLPCAVRSNSRLATGARDPQTPPKKTTYMNDITFSL
jgi:hypothetical protein